MEKSHDEICLFRASEKPSKMRATGVPSVAQQLTNPTRIHEDVGSIPSLTQWVKDPVLP